MTAKSNIKCKNIKEKRRKTFLFLLAWSLLILSLCISKNIAQYVNQGLELCASTVIASVFPFMILTDVISHTSGFEQIKFLRMGFERIFKVNGYAINAFIIGITCGFPLGVKVASELYKNKKISKEECERLIAFSNNTGPAFIIAGIGIGMRGSISDGVILYISMVLSALAVGAVSGIGKVYQKSTVKHDYENFEFSSSVKGAAINTLSVCGFVVLFSVICGVLSDLLKNSIILSLFLPFIEVTNASAILAKNTFLPSFIALFLTSFAISFSGFSVHFQAAAFLRGTDISMKKYYAMKLAQGFFSAIITLIIITIT